MIWGHTYQAWIGFHVLIFALLAFDLGVANRKAHVINLKEALGWSAFWIAIGLLFGVFVYSEYGPQSGVEYFTGYVVEKSLSVDNLFVFLVIFQALNIPRLRQHRLLYWGILGAIILRGLMITAGAALLEQFHWVIYIFGAFLVFTGAKILKGSDDQMDPHKSLVFKAAKKFLPLDLDDTSGHFFVRKKGHLHATTAFIGLLLIESSDVIFALDSVPAVFGVTRDPFIVYTSNIFAILGLRSLFFVLEDLLYKFHLLKVALGVILVLVGAKMIAEHWVHISPLVSLAIILTLLAGSIVASLIFPAKKKDRL